MLVATILTNYYQKGHQAGRCFQFVLSHCINLFSFINQQIFYILQINTFFSRSSQINLMK